MDVYPEEEDDEFTSDKISPFMHACSLHFHLGTFCLGQVLHLIFCINRYLRDGHC